MHRKELIDQWRADFEDAGWTVFVERAHERARMVEVATSALELGQKTVLLASMQTMRDSKKTSRLSKWNHPSAFAFCIIDEAHRSLAPSYRHIMDHFSMVPWVGLTATPQREGLANVWEIAYQESLKTMIDEGWLTPLMFHYKKMAWDWRTLKPPAGKDIPQTLIDEYFDGEKGRERIGPIQRAIRVYLHEHPGQALIYMPTARTASLIASWLNTEMQDDDKREQEKVWESEGKTPGEIREQLPYVATPVNAAAVTSKTDTETRDLTMRRFRNGTLRVVANFGIFTEGINVDDIEHVIMVRPTMLPGLYLQMIGRGARLHSSIKHEIGKLDSAAERNALIAQSPKPRCHIVQFVPPRHGAIDFCGPHTLVYDILPEMDPQEIRKLDFADMTLAEMEWAAQEAERERLEREEAEKDRAERERLLEYQAREKRSPWLVMQGAISVGTESVDLVERGARLVAYDDLQLSWTDYKNSGRTVCGDRATFSAAKKAVVEFWHQRAKNANKEKFLRYSGLPDALNGQPVSTHWKRWTGKRMEPAPRDRGPKPQREFDESRHAMAEKFREYLVHTGLSAERAHHAAGALFLLSTAWKPREINNELHYWWKAIDPAHENPAAAYVKPWGKRRRK
jgi:superfamily II DNA or RNA helicase